MAAGHHEADPFGVQVLEGEPAQLPPRPTVVVVTDRQIRLAAQQRVERLVRLQLGDLPAHSRMIARQRGQGRRHQVHGGGLERGHPHHPGHGPRRRGHLGLRLLHPGQQHLGVPGEHVPRLGEPQPAPVALQQPYPGLDLQLAELVRHRGRAVRQRLRDGGDRAPPPELAQQPQPMEIQHQGHSAPSRPRAAQ